MTGPAGTRAPDDVWTVAIYAGTGTAPHGTGVLIDDVRILTCAHVALRDGATRAGLRVVFAKAGRPLGQVRHVAEVRLSTDVDSADVAVLLLSEPAPAGVRAAPLKCPTPYSLVDRTWWSFGFPNDRHGSPSDGTVDANLALGLVRLEARNRYPVEPGFSGAGVWCHDYQAIVGLVVQAEADSGRGRALALYHADDHLPGEELRTLAGWSVAAAGDVALSAWGWSLSTDPEGGRHWIPRARGVSNNSEQGYRFRGRRAALEELVGWLDRPALDRRVLVVTGSPGVGKSAVLGRIVTTADPDLRTLLPADDDGVKASEHSVACAVHAKAKTALDVAVEVARAAAAELPARVEDLASLLRPSLSRHRGGRFSVVIDALDEARSPSEARMILTHIILAIAETCADVGAQMILGTRRRDDGGDILAQLAGSAHVVDLDTDRYFAEEDLAAYALATLQLSGDERADSPYTDPAAAVPLADRIARLAKGNFLVAGLTARCHGMNDTIAVRPDDLTFKPNVDAALHGYLATLRMVGPQPASMVLTPLGYAEAPGLTLAMWRSALAAFGTPVAEFELIRFARTAAANFVIESSTEGPTKSFRLFHQALDDALLRQREDLGLRRSDQAALTRMMIAEGRKAGWKHAGGYLLRSLPLHASEAGLIDELLAEDAYPLYADLRRLIPAADRATTPEGMTRARLLRLTPQAIRATPSERAALFSVTQELEQLGDSFPGLEHTSYQAQWANVPRRVERAVFEGHTDRVRAVCPITVDGRTLLVSGSNDRTVRLWDPATGQPERTLQGHTGWVTTVCPIVVDGRTLVASGSTDRTVRLWDPATGHTERFLPVHTGEVTSVCPVTIEGRSGLAIASNDHALLLWEPDTGHMRRFASGHSGGVTAVCPITIEERTLLAVVGNDHTVWLWNPATGHSERALQGPTEWTNSVCPLVIGERTLLATSSAYRPVRLWDPETGYAERTLHHHTDWINAICPIDVNGRNLLATACANRPVWLWDPTTGQIERTLYGHTAGVNAVCPITVNGRTLLATASSDHTVRLWDPTTDQPERTQRGHTDWINAVCPIIVDERTLAATGSNDRTVRLWNPATGQPERVLEGHTDGVTAVCPIVIEKRTSLATASYDGTVRLWNPATGQPERVLEGHNDWINAVCSITVNGRILLATASNDRTVRLWDPATGHTIRALHGHTGEVIAVSPITIQGRTLLATGGYDRTVRLWDPVTGHTVRILEGHTDWVRTVCPITVDGRSLLASGSDDRTVRLWDPATGHTERILEDHTDWINAVWPLTLDGRTLLATASNDRTVRLWGADGAPLISIPVHHQARACAWINAVLIVGLDVGVLSLSLTEDQILGEK